MTLTKDLALFKAKPEELNPYEIHFLLGNPFPGSGETGFDVCTDQNTIKREFVYQLQNFSTDTKRLRIDGKNGAGKTNILQYFERLTDEARWSGLIKKIYPIYVNSPEESYFNIHGQIVDKLAGFFLSDLIGVLQSDPKQIKDLSSKVKPAGELLVAIEAITQSTFASLPDQEEREKDAFVRWMKGQKLTAADKGLLTYQGSSPIDITNASLAMRFLYGLFIVLKELDLCDGIVLLFDEFEEIFEGLTRARQSQYAQDLRHLFDILKESVFFVTATVPEPNDLAQYPAIERRLGEPFALQPIDNLELAISYVLDYLNSARNKYETYLKEKERESERVRPKGLEPLTEDDVKNEYFSLKEELEKTEFDVLPGRFLPQIRERMRQIVESGD